MKRPVLYIVLIVILLVLIVSGLFYYNSKEHFNTSAMDAVPLNTECIFRIHSIKDLHAAMETKKGMYKELKDTEIFDDFGNLYSKLKAMLDKNDLDIDIDKSLTCATKLVGKNALDILYIVEMSDMSELKALSKLSADFLKEYTLRKKSYSGEDIYIYSNNNDRFSLVFVDGLFLMSKSVIFVEEAIRQMKSSNNLLNLSAFASVNKTVDESADINIFINNSNISSLTKLFAEPIYFSFFDKINKWGSWTALDIDFSSDRISANGFSCSSHNDYELFDVLADQEPVKSSLLKAIPASTSNFSLLALSNLTKYREGMTKYKGKISMLNAYRRGVLEMDRVFNSKFEADFYSCFAGEAACLSMSVNSLDVDANKISLLKASSEEKLTELANKIFINYANKNKASVSSYQSKIKINSKLSYTIYRMPFSDIAYRLLGDMFYKAPTDYCVVQGDNLVFGASVKILTDYLKALSSGKSITDDASFQDTYKRFSDKANFFFYANTYSSLAMLKSYLNPKYQALINRNKDCLNKFHSIGYQLTASNSMVYNNLFVLYADKLAYKPQTVWESTLEAKPNVKPAIVKNHSSDEMEIILQDEENNVYLLSSLGKILWKIKLDAKVNSDFYQVDAFRNKKLQYAFSTDKKLYLIDRNGKNVGKFPIEFNSSSKMGISLLDYDNNRNYRILVPTNNKKIYCYDIKGNIVKGWDFAGSKSEISSKIVYARISGKDYLAFKDKSIVYVLNRRGDILAKSKEIDWSNNEIVFDSNNACLFISDKDAAVFKVDFKGNTSAVLKPKAISKEHLFTAADINNDSKTDFIFADDSKLIVFSCGDKIIDFALDGEIKDVPSIYSFSNFKKMIGFVDADNSKAYLIDKNGDNYDGFPLDGASPFSISFVTGSSTGFYLFVGAEDNSIYKYKVQN